MLNVAAYEPEPERAGKPQLHAAVIHIIGWFLFLFLRQYPVGRAFIKASYQLPGSIVYTPDISFSSDKTRPLIAKGAAPYMPDFAVEIKSPDDKLNEMREKAAYYLANGTKLVWLVYPEKRLVIVLTPEGEDILTDKDTLDGWDVLPGFTVVVSEIFVD